MSNKTRKRIWPASLVVALAIVGALAALVVLSASPGSTSAHTPDGDHDQACMDMTPMEVDQHDEDELLINAADPMLCDEANAGDGAEPVEMDLPAVPGFTIAHGGQAGTA